jgi:putative acetyltransferase
VTQGLGCFATCAVSYRGICHVLKIAHSQSSQDTAGARELFREYAAQLGVDLCFQDFEKELAELPGGYAPPAGRLLLATVDGRLAGCVGLRRLSENIGEMKRLYVRPGFRGSGAGKALALKIIEEARQIGYGRMRLDTIPSKMQAAVAIYRSLGFEPIEPYCHNPIEGATFMELDLTKDA